jgi:uncharacterized protein
LELYILVVAYLGITMYAANQVQIGVWQPSVIKIAWYIATATMFLLAVFPIQIVLIGPEAVIEGEQLPQISMPAALATTIFAFAAGGISLSVVNSERARQVVANVVGSQGKFDPQSPVHITGIVLSSLLLSGVAVSFVLSGGITGLAESVETTGVDPGDTVFTLVLEVLAAGISVGYILRRTEKEALQRLGLQLPTRQQVFTAIAVGVGLAVVAQIYTVFYEPVAPQEQLDAVEMITRALSSLPMALLVAFAAAVGEELFVRGALQPVFGIFLSSIFFTLLHTQYFITPTLLVIFGISVVFGILRQRINTTAAIIAHFTYNFAPFLFFMIVAGGAG